MPSLDDSKREYFFVIIAIISTIIIIVVAFAQPDEKVEEKEIQLTLKEDDLGESPITLTPINNYTIHNKSSGNIIITANDLNVTADMNQPGYISFYLQNTGNETIPLVVVKMKAPYNLHISLKGYLFTWCEFGVSDRLYNIEPGNKTKFDFFFQLEPPFPGPYEIGIEVECYGSGGTADPLFLPVNLVYRLFLVDGEIQPC